MKCPRCRLDCIEVSTMKKHLVNYHSVNDQDIFFKELFQPDTIEKTCQISKETFKSCRLKKMHAFLYHYGKHNSRHFNNFVRGEIRDEIAKRIIANGQSGSSWYFKKFNRLTVIVAYREELKKLLLN